MATKNVFKFLEDNNRPYSINDILNGVNGNRGNKFTKNDIQKALDVLIDKEQVKEKIYGKQKIYFISQTKYKLSPAQMNEEIKSLDRQINQVTTTVEKQKENLKLNSAQCKTNEGKLTLQEIMEKRSNLEEELRNLKHSLKPYDGITSINPQDKLKIQNDFNHSLKTYKKMKKLSMEMIHTISDNCPNKKIIESIEIETDEAAGFNLDEILMHNK